MANRQFKKREIGIEISGFEHKLIYGMDDSGVKEDAGFVRYQNKREGEFYLDPSPWMKDPWGILYVMQPGKQAPPTGDLVRVTIQGEITEQVPDPRCVGTFKNKIIRGATSWSRLDPNTIRSNRGIRKEELMDCLTLPMKKSYDLDDAGLLLALYAVACPPVHDMDQGGIDAFIQTSFYDQEKKTGFSHAMAVIPTEFRRINTRNLYRIQCTGIRPISPDSLEMSLAWWNIPGIDAPLNLNFDYEFRPYTSYKEDMDYRIQAARTFMLDALLYHPTVGPDLAKKLQDALHEVADNTARRAGEKEEPFNISEKLEKLAASWARVNCQNDVSRDDLKRSVELFTDATVRAEKTNQAASHSPDFRRLPAHERRLFTEIFDMASTGQPVTIEDLKRTTKVPADIYDKSLINLERKNFISIINEQIYVREK